MKHLSLSQISKLDDIWHNNIINSTIDMVLTDHIYRQLCSHASYTGLYLLINFEIRKQIK